MKWPLFWEHELVCWGSLFMMGRNNDEDCNNIKTSSILTDENVPILLLNSLLSTMNLQPHVVCHALGSFSPFKVVAKAEIWWNKIVSHHNKIKFKGRIILLVGTMTVFAWSSIFVTSISFLSLFPIQTMFPAAHHGQELSNGYVNLVRGARYHEKSNPGLKTWSVNIPLETMGFILLRHFWYAYLIVKKLTLTSLGPRISMGIKVFHPKFFHGDSINIQIKCVMIWRNICVDSLTSLLAVGSLRISDCNGISNACAISCLLLHVTDNLKWLFQQKILLLQKWHQLLETGEQCGNSSMWQVPRIMLLLYNVTSKGALFKCLGLVEVYISEKNTRNIQFVF